LTIKDLGSKNAVHKRILLFELWNLGRGQDNLTLTKVKKRPYRGHAREESR